VEPAHPVRQRLRDLLLGLGRPPTMTGMCSSTARALSSSPPDATSKPATSGASARSSGWALLAFMA
jgi:hypothetical protein